MRYILLLFVTTLLFSCSDKTNSLVSKYLNSDNIPAQLITIDVTRDTSLVLKGGTKLHIPKGTLKTKGNKPAVLQVKEVLTPEQMLAAGMFTESDGKPLRSGGMLFIDADSSVDVELAGQIVAEIPTKAVDDGMQLFKGERSDDGTINWTDPEPIQNDTSNNNNIGQQLFIENCASCHHPVKSLMGPPLAGADYRFPENREGSELWYAGRQHLYEYIKNPAAFGLHGELLCAITNNYGGPGVQMPGFPALSERDIDAIIDYANKEALKAGIDPSTFIPAEIDSCRKHIAEYDLLNNAKDSLEKSRKPFIAVTNTPDQPFVPLTGEPGTTSIWEDNKVTPQHFTADYYRIEIETFGWYNVDRFIEEAEESELFVKLTGTHSNKNQVFLVIPSIKMMAEGGFLEDSSGYGFYTKDGKIPLIRGLEAFVFTIGESPDNPQLYFGQTKFITSSSQMVSINMQPLSQEQLQKNLMSFSFADFKANVIRDSTKETIQSLDDKILKLQEKLKRCDCGSKVDSVAMAATR